MESLPHKYVVSARSGHSDPLVTLKCENLNELVSAPPKQFGGPGDQWSPEDLFVAAIADCFVLTFRAIARGKKLVWTEIECEVAATLERLDGKTRFTNVKIRPTLEIVGSESEKAQKILQQAEDSCLITNSLSCEVHLHDLKISELTS